MIYARSDTAVVGNLFAVGGHYDVCNVTRGPRKDFQAKGEAGGIKKGKMPD